MQISIVIPAFNQLEYCRQCVQSIQANTARDHKLILVDNGSTDGVSDYFDSVPGATVVHSPENLGFAGGVNLGMREAEGHVLLLNSDTLVPRGWLTRLENALLREANVGIVGPMSNCVSGSQLIEGLDFDSLDEVTAYADRLAAEKAGRNRDVARLVGFCMLIHADVVAEVGLLDEGYGIGNFEDDDFCLRTLRAGYRLCVAEDCFVFHYGSRTFISMGLVDDAWRDLIATNQRRFEEKWEVRPEERVDAVQEARQRAREGLRAADHGDLAGALRSFKEALSGAPMDDQVNAAYGGLLLEMGERDRAVDHCRRALRANPANEEARGTLRAAGGDDEA